MPKDRSCPIRETALKKAIQFQQPAILALQSWTKDRKERIFYKQNKKNCTRDTTCDRPATPFLEE
ncbi:hypothetical protein NC651_015912 [Populus alba x Populus x berolinensis]|nr:hypothetical protein NC651_015912 [Populus alba x Populus x berolinensis]